MDNIVSPSIANQSLKCSGCGALLKFAPGTDNLKCDYCGSTNAINNKHDKQQITSVDYDVFVNNINTYNQSSVFKVLDCENCGSQTILDEFVSSDKCSFCTSPLVLNMDKGQHYVRPHYILPFEVTSQQGAVFFNKWLKSLWWAPNDLNKKVNSNASALNGIYLPHWAFDTDVETRYRGQRGVYYYTTETYTVQVNGKSEVRERRVRHTNWSYASGTVYNGFQDILVPASKSLPEETILKLEPWKFNQLVEFDERYLSGFKSETYQIDPKQGFLNAAAQIAGRINDSIRRDIGGDEQRVDNTDSDYNNKAIKYLMLPVWVSAYNYNGKIYQFTINACTGEVIGERPLSAIKITLAILVGLLLIAAAIYFYNVNRQSFQ